MTLPHTPSLSSVRGRPCDARAMALPHYPFHAASYFPPPAGPLVAEHPAYMAYMAPEAASSNVRAAAAESYPLLSSVLEAPPYSLNDVSLDLSDDWPPGRPLRIVHLGTCFMHGGSEQHALDLAQALCPTRANIEKFLVVRPDLVMPAQVARAGVAVEPATRESILAAVNEYDVLLYWGTPLDEHLADQPRSAKVVYISHGEGDWINGVLTGSIRSTDHVVAVSPRVRDSLRCRLPTTLIPNGIDTKRLATSCPKSEMRAALGFAPTDFVTGFVGRFSPEKRPELLIHALRRLPPHHKALLVGYGPLEPMLMELANRLIPGRYAFRFAADYMGDYYGAMDAFCLLSDTEGFALVLLEAMMAGKAVITTDVGSVPQLIRDRITGVIVDSAPASVAAAIESIAGSPDWARALGAAAARLADEVGHASQMARKYEQLFAQLVAPPPASPRS